MEVWDVVELSGVVAYKGTQSIDEVVNFVARKIGDSETTNNPKTTLAQ